MSAEADQETLPLSVRVSVAIKLAEALQALCKENEGNVVPDWAESAAAAHRELLDARGSLFGELVKRMPAGEAGCECNNYGLDDALKAVYRAQVEAGRQCQPADDTSMGTAAFHLHCIEAAEWIGHGIEHLLAD